MYDKNIIDNKESTAEDKSAILDEMLLSVGEKLEEHYNNMAVKQDKVKEVLRAYKLLQHIAQGKNVKVTYSLHKPYKTNGCVSVEGKDIHFTDTKGFVLLTDLAANVDIYPKTNGNVRIDFAFVGLVAPDGKEDCND